MSMSRVRWTDELRERVYHKMFEWLGQHYDAWELASQEHASGPHFVFKNTLGSRTAFIHAQQMLALPKAQRRESFSFHELHELLHKSYLRWLKLKRLDAKELANPGRVDVEQVAVRLEPVAAPKVEDLRSKLFGIELELVKERFEQDNKLIAELRATVDSLTSQVSKQAEALKALEAVVIDLIGSIKSEPTVTAATPKQRRFVAAIIGVHDSHKPIWKAKLDDLNAKTGNKLKFNFFQGREGNFGWYDMCFYMTDNSQHTTYYNVKRGARNAGAQFEHVTGSISALLTQIEAAIKKLP